MYVHENVLYVYGAVSTSVQHLAVAVRRLSDWSHMRQVLPKLSCQFNAALYRCSVDPVLVGELVYAPEGETAWVESHAFKFADTTYLSFSCTIQLCSEFSGKRTCENLSVRFEGDNLSIDIDPS